MYFSSKTKLFREQKIFKNSNSKNLLFSSAPRGNEDEVDGAVNCRGGTTVRVPYQRLDSLKNVYWYQQFAAVAYKKLLFLKNDWILALFLVCY